MIDIRSFFLNGMKRELKYLHEPPFEKSHKVVILGAGRQKSITGKQPPNIEYVPYDFPEWNGETDRIPHEDNSVAAVVAFHFLEHLSNPVRMLKEMERVLVKGGVAYIVVPSHLGSMAYHDITHKTFFTLDTWKTLFSTPYYDTGEWKFEIGFNAIIGITERNLAIFTQLIKVQQ